MTVTGTNQGDRQASVRAATGTTWTYEGDWHALFDLAGVAAGDFNGRMLAYINNRLSTSYTDLNGAMYAFAVDQGATSWSGLGTFTASVTPVAPVKTGDPAISGNPWPSSTLAVSNGTWTGYPAPTFTYQWKSGGVDISAATSQTYRVASADLAAVITCAVTATNSAGTPSATSAGVTIVEVPIITATPASSTLYVSEGDSQTAGGGSQGNTYSVLFAGSDTSDITYVNQAVSGNKLADLVARAATTGGLIASHPGKSNYNLTVLVGTNDIATGTYYPSGAAAFVTALSSYLTTMRGYGYDITVCTILPRTSGVTQATFDAWVASVNTGIKALEGGSNCQKVIDLYADAVMGGAVNAAADTTLYYDGLHPTQRGHNYIERVVAGPLSARMTAAVAPTIASATISGSTVDGQILTATGNGVTGKGTPTYAYQWKRNGSNISAATNSTYTLQPADVGTTITVTITVTNEVSSASATSAATATITEVPVPVNSVAPVISGTVTQGQTLTTTNGTWSNSPSSYTYQWKRGGVTIGGATASTYTLQVADVGSNMTCAVVGVNAGGSGTAATSNSLGPVIAGSALLDALSASSTAAYSTRKLRNAYAGSAIKVRRSSDNTTQDIGFDGSGNLDAAALVTFVGANSGFIDTWYDQSGNGNDLAQATTANQPRIRNAGTTDTLNSQPVIYWPTANVATCLTRATGFPASSAFSISALIGPTTATGTTIGIVGGAGLSAGGYALYCGSGIIRTLYNGGTAGATESSVNQFSSLGTQASYVLTRNISGTAYDQIFRAASSRVTRQATYTVSSTEITVGNLGAATTGSSYQGAIPEVIIFASVLSSADLALIDGSHSSYWGTTANRYQDATLAAQTGLTTPTGYVAAASSTTGGFPAWQAFDQNQFTDFVSGAAIATLQRQIPTAKTLTAYSVAAGGTAGANVSAPKTWTFEGSNNGSSWTTLDTISTDQLSWMDTERRIYPIAGGSQGSYTYHRLNVATSNNASFFWVGEVEFITS